MQPWAACGSWRRNSREPSTSPSESGREGPRGCVVVPLPVLLLFSVPCTQGPASPEAPGQAPFAPDILCNFQRRCSVVGLLLGNTGKGISKANPFHGPVAGPQLTCHYNGDELCTQYMFSVHQELMKWCKSGFNGGFFHARLTTTPMYFYTIMILETSPLLCSQLLGLQAKETWDGPDPTAKDRPRTSWWVNSSRTKHWSTLNAQTPKFLNGDRLFSLTQNPGD